MYSKGMLKFGLNKEKKRISLLQLLKLAGIIVFSDTFPLLSICCLFKSEQEKKGKVLPLPHPNTHPQQREKNIWDPDMVGSHRAPLGALGNRQTFRDSSLLFFPTPFLPLGVSWQSTFYCVIIHWFLVSSCAFKKEKQNIIF